MDAPRRFKLDPRIATLVTVVAALIWIVAESEGLGTTQLRLTVQLASGTRAGEAFVNVREPGGVWQEVGSDEGWAANVEISIEGSASALDALRAKRAEPIVLRPGMPGFSDASGDHTLALRDLLSPLDRFRGFTITAVSPESVPVRVERLVVRTIPVAAGIGDAVTTGEIVVTPPEATIVFPESVRESVAGVSALPARVTPDQLASRPPGQPLSVSVPVEAPQALRGVWSRIEPPRVNVSLTLQSRTASHTVLSVPVQILIPPDEIGRYSIVVPPQDQQIRDVTVTGPVNLIEQIKTGALPIVAIVRLSFDDLVKRVTSKDATFTVFPGELSFKAEDVTVSLEIHPVEEAGAEPAAGAPAGE